MEKDFNNKIAIVTGAASGIGKATALAFSKLGGKVVIVDKNVEEGKNTSKEINESGGNAIFIATDVSDEQSVKEMVNKVISEFQGIDILFNNAGLKHFGSLESTTGEMWDEVIDSNLKSVFLCSKYCVPHMKERGGGNIINSGSTQVTNPDPDVIAYVSSKAGIITLTFALAQELLGTNIRVNCISPGSIKTHMFDLVTSHQFPSTQERTAAIAETNNGTIPIGTPESIANVVVFLCSKDAYYINGSVLTVDGGLSIRGLTPRRMMRGG
jgi:NAD(P)-dependent dehydrogenase (short-subunit alcohol dehydrogenase family)